MREQHVIIVEPCDDIFRKSLEPEVASVTLHFDTAQVLVVVREESARGRAFILAALWECLARLEALYALSEAERADLRRAVPQNEG